MLESVETETINKLFVSLMGEGELPMPVGNTTTSVSCGLGSSSHSLMGLMVTDFY